jgi:hypothetical protein
MDFRNRAATSALHLVRAAGLGLAGFAATAGLWFGLSLADPAIGSPVAAEIVCAVLFATSEILNCGRGHAAGMLRRIIVTAGALFSYLSVMALTHILLFGPGPEYRKGDPRPTPESNAIPFFLLCAGFVVLMFVIRTLWARRAPPKEPAGSATGT